MGFKILHGFLKNEMARKWIKTLEVASSYTSEALISSLVIFRLIEAINLPHYLKLIPYGNVNFMPGAMSQQITMKQNSAQKLGVIQLSVPVYLIKQSSK